MTRRLPTLLAAGVLAVAGTVATGTAASAQAIACPGGSTYSAYQNAQSRGTVVEEYWLNRTAVVVYRVDNRYEAFVTNGMQVARTCSTNKPARPAGATDKPAVGAQREINGGSANVGSGGGSLGPGAWSSGGVITGTVTVRLQKY